MKSASRDQDQVSATATAHSGKYQGQVSAADDSGRISKRFAVQPPHDHLRVVHEVVWVADEVSDVKGKASRFATLDIRNLTGWKESMNDPEVIMLDALPNGTLAAHQKALQAAGLSIALVSRVPAPLKSLADQAIRSASSVPANLAEGHGRSGRDRTYHWRIAYASAKEVDCHLRLLAQAGSIDNSRANTALRLFDEVRAMTWRLLHPKA